MVLAQRHQVMALDVDPRKVNLVNARCSPLEGDEMAAWLSQRTLDLRATLSPSDALGSVDVVFVATPTDYSTVSNFFDTSSVEEVIAQVRAICPRALVVIKSTVPVGFTQAMRNRYGTDNLIFSPEFLREGHELRDCQCPSRIVVGDQTANGRLVADLLLEGVTDEDIPVLFTGSAEAEAIKLFSNTYLAMRVAFFNELDTYAASLNIDSRNIVDGVCMDPRIGNFYNNPSFGYGGYCLPKDVKQLLQNYHGIPQKIIHAVVQANATRKDFVAKEIIRRNPGVVGVYRLSMKAGSSNIRDNSTQEIMMHLKGQGVKVIIYEPAMGGSDFHGCQVIYDFEVFKLQADIIIANRITSELNDVMSKVYSRDLFGRDG
jgi:UDPglucose 6-dehydrogenase